MAQPASRTIVATVRAFARERAIFRPGPIVLAVSGGTDSVALALILAELREEFGLVLHVAHFDHRTRPRSAPKDAAFVADLANHIGAALRVGRAARAPKNEDDARTDRYAFLRRFATEIGATAIATGHTMDDQAETVLLHLARGAGVSGAAGMRPLRDRIARPLLAIGRAETRAICAAARIRPREDPSNRSLRFARNRVRLRVLPELERLNPQIRAALARFADAAAEVEHAMASNTKDDVSAADSIAAPRETARPPDMDVHALPADPAARERALAEAWVVAGGIVLSASHRAGLLKLASTTAGSRRIDLPGGQAVREYARLFFVLTATASNAIAAGPTTAAPVALRRGAPVMWHGWRIALDMPSDGSAHSGAIESASAAHLAVRSRRPGDRVVKMGKLQDLFVDAKIPARARDTWPLVTLNDAVIWVPGVTPAPQTGSVAIAAEPAADGPTNGDSPRASYLPVRQVASRAVLRPRGGKRGRP